MIEGCFEEHDLRNSFQYKSTDDEWAVKHDLPFEIYFPNTGEKRFARILKTVVYLAEDGSPVLNKWHGKRLWHREVT